MYREKVDFPLTKTQTLLWSRVNTFDAEKNKQNTSTLSLICFPSCCIASAAETTKKKARAFFLPTRRVFFSQTLVKYRHKTTNKRASGEKAFQGCGGGEFPRSQCITTRGRARPLSRQKRWPYMFVPTGIDGRTFLLDLLRL